MIEEWDLNVRFISIGACLMLLALLATGEARRDIRISLIGLVICVIAYLLNSTPLTAPETLVDPWVDLLSLFAPFWIWIFARRLFEREPQRRIAIAAVIALVVFWFMGNFFTAPQVFAFYAIHIVSLALIIDLVRVALGGRDDDLIEKRRTIRLLLPLLVAAQAGGILVFEMFVGPMLTLPWIQLANALLILLLALFVGVALLQTDSQLLVESNADLLAADQVAPDLSPAETVLHDKLIGAMEVGYYREPGLTIASLAAHLDTPEHRLRALINQRLGHRNFSAFLNLYRVEEAKAILADRERVDLPVLTIAMDLGYNSLPTFNRAFRGETGTTPSDFRRLAITGSSEQN